MFRPSAFRDKGARAHDLAIDDLETQIKVRPAFTVRLGWDNQVIPDFGDQLFKHGDLCLMASSLGSGDPKRDFETVGPTGASVKFSRAPESRRLHCRYRMQWIVDSDERHPPRFL